MAGRGGGEDDLTANGVHGKAPSSTDSVRLAALELATMSAIPGAVAALARLNNFDGLAQAGNDTLLTAPELAELAWPGKSINLTYLGRFLRMMASKNVLHGVVTTGDDGPPEPRYALNPRGRFFAEDQEKGSFISMLLTFQFPGGFLPTWEHIHESILDGRVQPFVGAHGMNVWEHGIQNWEFDEVFNKAMAGHTKTYMRAILDAYHGFEDVHLLVDVGGGFASSLSLITAWYPHIKGINFDQLHVIDACP